MDILAQDFYVLLGLGVVCKKSVIKNDNDTYDLIGILKLYYQTYIESHKLVKNGVR